MSEPVRSAIEHLSKKEGFECKDVLGKGSYGSVIKVVSKQRGSFAAKIVESRLVNNLELKEWIGFRHLNVLALLDLVLNADGAVIFLTELMQTNLFERLFNEDFKKDKHALTRCRIYARQILCGVNYLHSKHFCHMDIRAENVLISFDDRAVLADFSGLCHSVDVKRHCPLPYVLRPPEKLKGQGCRVLPVPVDLWAYGLLLSNIFLGRGFYFATVKHKKSGTLEAVSDYIHNFQDYAFVKKSLRVTYPNCTLPDAQVMELMNIVDLFLQVEPECRISANVALKHEFFRHDIDIVSLDESSSEDSCTCLVEMSEQDSETASATKTKHPVTNQTQDPNQNKNEIKDLSVDKTINIPIKLTGQVSATAIQELANALNENTDTDVKVVVANGKIITPWRKFKKRFRRLRLWKKRESKNVKGKSKSHIKLVKK